MGKYIGMFMNDMANFGLKISDSLSQLSNKIMGWSYATKQSLFEKYGVEFDELF